MKTSKKALIAMSGGVDSSVAAYIMKSRGYDCIGVTMKLFQNEDIGVSKEHSCCSLDDVEDAKNIAFSLNMPHYVFNFADRFKECVIDRFVYSYENGITPNPCIDCNRYLKFDKLYNRAIELECDCVVTGHYAKIELDKASGKYLLKKADDLTKDQSYVLYTLTQQQLAHTVFPLGSMNKPDVRKVAEENGFINAHKHDSQDICFVQNGKYSEFIKEYTGKDYPDGNFVDTKENVLGRHKGIIKYTIGQRRGLGLALPESLYVVGIDIDKNEVILGKNEELFKTGFTAKDFNWISGEEPKGEIEVLAKTRYRQPEKPAVASVNKDGTVSVRFSEPQRAITPGQSAVLYDGDTVLGGGIIV